MSTRFKALYEEILGETDNDARLKKAEELKNLKEISNKLHEAVSDLHEEEDEVCTIVHNIIDRGTKFMLNIQ